MNLQGKRVVVTGAAQGLGREIAKTLAREGAQVLTLDVRADGAAATAGEIASAGGEAQALPADVTDPRDWERVQTWVTEHWSGLDGLVNNAAIYEGIPRRPFDEVPEEEWDRVMTVNVKGVWLAVRALASAIYVAGGGAIVNLASEVAFTGSHGFPHYVASKGAVISLTRALARELGPRQIRVNALAPGFTDTPASRRLADIARYDLSPTPLGRIGAPQDIAGLAVYLLSDASSFITGQTWLVNGGRTMA